ncbi:hypothetical protein Cgig2_023414 [Carnegiea gigantea]|uniref:Uncharacterized protein n=1 Tax=Carnegiea gigantea TaxID=171969 RepID=A0A9Q1K4A8_9CARY|nr:hypothetical protein Cgig2_023414 [Carnegiea gigantea]
MEKEVEELNEVVKMELLGSSNKPKEQLELIDAMERLGVAYHFEQEIEEALLQLNAIKHDQEDLYHVSLRFRILRQHGFHVSSDVFKRFKDDKGGYKGEVEGILSLYEACHVRIQGDNILDDAAEFTTAYLKSVVKELRPPLAEQVAHALHQPLHRGMTQVEARQQIAFYEHKALHSTNLLRFAKLDFNLLQSLHQMELTEVARWWKRVHSKMPYTRDRSVEAYFWALGTYYEPQYSFARKILTKVVLLTQLLDDTYDAYGTIQTLDLLTHAIDRFSGNIVAWLSCQKISDVVVKHFLKLSTVLSKIWPKKGGHTAYNMQKNRQMAQLPVRSAQKLEGVDLKAAAQRLLLYSGPSLVRDPLLYFLLGLMKRSSLAWLQEAKWCHEKYVPTYDEYMEVALESIGHVVGIVGSYLGMGEIATEEAFEWICQTPMPKLVKASDIILRLMNDMGGHEFEQSSRNHVTSSVQCYMKQHGIKDDKQTYEALEKLVEDAWKDVNQAMLKPYKVPKPCLDRLLNLARVPNVMYKARTDGYTLVNDTIMHKVSSVLIHPIPL